MTKLLHVTLAAGALFVWASAAMAQDARTRADSLENGLQPHGLYLRSPGLSGVARKSGRPYGRSSAYLIAPRNAPGCSRQTANETAAGRKVGRFSIAGI